MNTSAEVGPGRGWPWRERPYAETRDSRADSRRFVSSVLQYSLVRWASRSHAHARPVVVFPLLNLMLNLILRLCHYLPSPSSLSSVLISSITLIQRRRKEKSILKRRKPQTLPSSLETVLHYKSQTAIDFSPIVTRNMQARYPTIKFLEMDIRALTFPSCSFDICIDKATLDAMLYGSLWDPEDEVRENVGRYVDEVRFTLSLVVCWES